MLVALTAKRSVDIGSCRTNVSYVNRIMALNVLYIDVVFLSLI